LHQHKTNVIGALVKQLIDQRNRLLPYVEKLYDERRSAARPADWELVECFHQYKEQFDSVILVIDVFDECGIREEITNFLQDISGGMTIFITARTFLLENLRPLNPTIVALTEQHNSIREFIAAKLTAYRNIPDDLKIKIQNEITTQSDGMYMQRAQGFHQGL
jgi:hypothetical protein